jgi:hypothetical protein
MTARTGERHASNPSRGAGRWATSVAELVAGVSSGSRIGVSGFHFTRAPMAQLRALAEGGIRDLDYIAWGGGLPLEFLLGQDMVSRATLCFSSLDVLGPAPRFRRAVESGRLELNEWTALGIMNGLRAAGENLAFEVLQEPAGSSLTAGFSRPAPDPHGSAATPMVAPLDAFGADDLRVCRRYDLPVVNPVDLEGRFTEPVSDFAGRFVKDADAGIVDQLSERGLLVKSGTYRHTYPFCWRCDTPLLYYAKPSWYIATTRLRDRLLEVNAGVDWHPAHIRDGRYGNWLENTLDWPL